MASDKKILCVDDSEDSAVLLESCLSPYFECVTVHDAASALSALEHDGPFTVVVSDYLMPEMDGIEFLSRVKAGWPDCVRVMITGSDDLDIAISALHDGNVYRFVRKPFQAADITFAVNEAVAYHQLVQSEKHLRTQLADANALLDEKVQDLDEANELLEYWVEFSPAVLYSFSVEYGEIRPSYISKNFLKLSGYERTTAIIEAGFWHQLIAPGDQARVQEMLLSLLRGEQLHAVTEYTITHKAGDAVRLVDSVRAVQDGNGETVELVGAWLDVSAREG